jgi:hypothetical protein
LELFGLDYISDTANSTMDELCSVCKTLNLTFKFPPQEIPFEKWLENWERERPHYNWRTQDRSIEARIQRRLEELREESWSDSEFASDDNMLDSSSVSPDLGGEAADSSPSNVLGSDDSSNDDSIAQSVPKNRADSEKMWSDSKSLDDGHDLSSTENAKDVYLDAQEHQDSDEDSDPKPYQESYESLNADDLSDGIGHECLEKLPQQDKEDDADREASLKIIRQEANILAQRKLENVLNFIGLDTRQYRADNLYSDKDGHWRGTRVLKRKEVEDTESGYESDDQSTIADFLSWGRDYASKNDEDFERYIRDETDPHWARLALKDRWSLGKSTSLLFLTRSNFRCRQSLQVI